MPEKQTVERVGRKMQLVERVEQHIGPIAADYRAALLEVDRAEFVDDALRSQAYLDAPIPLSTPYGQHAATVSAPHMYVLGFSALKLGAGDRLLELGSGSGYGAALASHVVGPRGFVTTVEVDPHLAGRAFDITARLGNVDVVHGDGLAAGGLLATHNKCWLTFAVDEVPTNLIEHLKEDAILVAPVGPPEAQHLMRYERRKGYVVADDLGLVLFVGARALITD